MPDAIAAQAIFLRAAGADGVMALGSTGEFIHLDVPERVEVFRIIAAATPGWPMIANCSDTSPRRVAALAAGARDAGAAAIALLPPWYFPCAGRDVVEFMVRGAEAARLPLLIYNFPERTGHRLSLETIAAVCDRVPVVALKQSGAEFEYHRALASLGNEKGFVVCTGADTRIPEAVALGARGVVCGLANICPEWIVATLKAALAGDTATANSNSTKIGELASALHGLEFPIDVAAAMKGRGRPTGELKQSLSPATRKRMDEVESDVRVLLTRHGLA